MNMMYKIHKNKNPEEQQSLCASSSCSFRQTTKEKIEGPSEHSGKKKNFRDASSILQRNGPRVRTEGRIGDDVCDFDGPAGVRVYEDQVGAEPHWKIRREVLRRIGAGTSSRERTSRRRISVESSRPSKEASLPIVTTQNFYNDHNMILGTIADIVRAVVRGSVRGIFLLNAALWHNHTNAT